MTYNSDKNYIFTKEQLLVLLVCSGAKSVKGFNFDDNLPDKQTVLQILSELSEKNYICSDGENFSLTGEVADIIEYIAFVQKFFIVRCRNVSVPDLLCYGKEKGFVVVEPFGNSENKFRISLHNAESLFSKFLDEGFIEQFSDGFMPETDEIEEFERQHLCAKNVFEPEGEESRRIFSLNLLLDTKTAKYVDLVEYYLCNYIMIFDGKNVLREVYTTEKMEEAITKILEE